MKSCILSSNRLSRWIIQIQEYDLGVIHIPNWKNHLADTLSRNPAELNPEEVARITRPTEIFVAAIDLGVDNEIRKEIKTLDTLQKSDPKT
jgi:hypothetical protein